MKTCSKCYEEKNESEFGKDTQKIDGFSSYCKECLKKRSAYQRKLQPQKYNEYSKEYREKNRELLKEKSRIDYYQNWDKRKEQSQRSYKKHREEIARKRAEKRHTEDQREKERQRQREWRKKNPTKAGTTVSQWKKRNPQKSSSHSLVCWAVKSGVLKRPEDCMECGKKCKPHAHHEDYSKPLDVIWICKICHGKKHRKIVGDLLIS